jgi:hypothetical protein
VAFGLANSCLFAPYLKGTSKACDRFPQAARRGAADWLDDRFRRTPRGSARVALRPKKALWCGSYEATFLPI